jgi:hypothetical protein
VSSETSAIDPPPAPTLRTSSVGALAGKAPTSVEREIVGMPSTITETSVDVPPMSKAISFGRPDLRAIITVEVTPPAGPESTVWTGRSEAAAALISPPSDRTICSRAFTPSSRSRLSIRDR